MRSTLRHDRLAPGGARGRQRRHVDGGPARRLELAEARVAGVDRSDREGGIEHVHATFGTRTATLARIVSRLSGVPFSFTTHAYDIFIRNPTLEWKAREASFVRTISK